MESTFWVEIREVRNGVKGEPVTFVTPAYDMPDALRNVVRFLVILRQGCVRVELLPKETSDGD